MAIELPTNSRFVDSEVVIKDGQETFGRWKRPSWFDLLSEEDVRIIIVTNSRKGRPDLIALDLYGSSFLDWTLVMLNRPRNPIGWPKTGTAIRAIKSSIVLANT